MTLSDDINTFCQHFSDQIRYISQKADGLHCRILWVTMFDAISRAANPHLADKNKIRVITFLEDFCDWPDKDRVSIPQLKMLLGKKGVTSGALMTDILRRLATWKTNSTIWSLKDDPPPEDLLVNANLNEIKLIEDAKHKSRFYRYRNSLVHEFRTPGYGMDEISHCKSPFYHYMNVVGGIGEWELVYPASFLNRLCEIGLQNLKKALIKEGRNPFDAYEFGSLW